MEDKRGEFMSCAHMTEIENYCQECKIFCCDACSMVHIDHIDQLLIWTTIIENYLKNCERCKNISRLIVKNKIDIDYLKGEIFTKIEEGFAKLFDKLIIYKTQLKEEIWEIMMSNGNILTGEAKNHLKFKRSLEELDFQISELTSQRDLGEKENMIRNLQNNMLQEVEKQIEIQKGSSSKEYAKELREFHISDNFSLEELKKYFNIKLPSQVKTIYSENLRCTFPNYSNIWRKKEGLYGDTKVCSPEILPPHFKLSIRVNNNPNVYQRFCLGVCKEKFSTKKSDSYGLWLKDQWAYHGYDGQIQEFGRKSIPGNGKFSASGSIVSLVYQKSKELSFEVNGHLQPRKLYNVEGPFYFWASLFNEESELEILDLLML